MNELDDVSGAKNGLRELALFAGAGGGILGGKLLGWRTVCAVEIDEYARGVIRARQLDGLLPLFPVFEDINHVLFDSSARVMFDSRYYDRQTEEGLSESEGALRVGDVHFRGSVFLRKDTAVDVGVVEGSRCKNETSKKIRGGKSLLQGRKNGKRQGAEHFGVRHQEGVDDPNAVLRAVWMPWTIQGWKEFDSSAPPRLQRPASGNVAMPEMPPRVAQIIQGGREKVINGEPDRIAFIGDVDVVSGGFPCVDISCAGRGAGITGPSSGLWKQMARIVGEVRPRYVFVENSPMLVRRGLGAVLGDLSEMGYDARWGIVGAHHAGAPHKRDRIWILADAANNWDGWWKQQQEGGKSSRHVADTIS